MKSHPARSGHSRMGGGSTPDDSSLPGQHQIRCVSCLVSQPGVEPPIPSSLLYGDGAPATPSIFGQIKEVLSVPSPHVSVRVSHLGGCTKTPESLYEINRNGCTKTFGIRTQPKRSPPSREDSA